MRRLLRHLGLITVVAVAACQAPPPPPPPPPPTIVQLTLAADGTINPGPNGQAAPVNVSYYQLAASEGFEVPDYFQIHGKEAAALGKDLLDQQEVPLTPGASKAVTLEGKPGVKFLGVIASFRDIDHATWRAVAPIPANKTTKLKIMVTKLQVSIQPDDAK